MKADEGISKMVAVGRMLSCHSVSMGIALAPEVGVKAVGRAYLASTTCLKVSFPIQCMCELSG